MKLGACTLIEKIAEGSIAEIYLAKAPTTSGEEKCLVCKCVRPAVAGDSEFYDSIMTELECAGPLRHPNVVTIFNFCVENGNAFLTMEYFDAKDLRYLINALHAKQQSLPYPFAIHIVSQVAKGLHAVHELKDFMGNPKQIVHRDVTPENIYFGSDGRIKLGDFGIAKAEGRLTATPTDIIRGKFRYLSPEQAWCDSLDRRSDIYALAIILYEAVLGVPFYRADSIDQIITEARCGLHVSPLKIDPSFPPDLCAIIEKAVDLDKSHRYQTALEFRDALLGFATAHQCTVSRQDWINFLCANVPVVKAPLALMAPDEMAEDPSIFIVPEISPDHFSDDNFVPDNLATNRNDSLAIRTYQQPYHSGSGSAPRMPQMSGSGSGPRMPQMSGTGSGPRLPQMSGTGSGPRMPQMPGTGSGPRLPQMPGTGSGPRLPQPSYTSAPSLMQSSAPLSVPSFASQPVVPMQYPPAQETMPLADAAMFSQAFSSTDDCPSATAIAIPAQPEDPSELDDMDNLPTECAGKVIDPEAQDLAESFDMLTNDLGVSPELLDGGTDTIPMEAPTPELLEALQLQFKAKQEADAAGTSSLGETVPLIKTSDYKQLLPSKQTGTASGGQAENAGGKGSLQSLKRRDPEPGGFQIIKDGKIQPQVILILCLIVLIAGMLGFLIATLILK